MDKLAHEDHLGHKRRNLGFFFHLFADQGYIEETEHLRHYQELKEIYGSVRTLKGFKKLSSQAMLTSLP